MARFLSRSHRPVRWEILGSSGWVIMVFPFRIDDNGSQAF